MNAKRKLRRSLVYGRESTFSKFLLIFSIIFNLIVFALIIPDSRLASWYMNNSSSYKTVEYRGATITYPKNVFPEEKLLVFYTVVDSLNDHVKEEFSIKKVPMNVYVNMVTLETFFDRHLAGTAVGSSLSIFLKPCSYNGELNNGDLAMILVHEYVHIIQFDSPNFLQDYEEKIGWNQYEATKSESFYRVLSDYSLTSPSEDMSETFMYPYLCGNNLDALSSERLVEALSFWKVPREEFCRNFN